jgi:transcriptional regulator with XRE-family HTH domain
MPYLRGLKRARARRLMTIRELAARAGVSTTTIVHLESLEQEARMSTARRLATALEVSPDELLGEGLEGEGAAAA